ncbi:hypothetical protein OG792_18800 [Micromonospora sp. NBC_01699]|uniref:hypothetical protein n=1 Tax=Micromonospora sp. NBC_01699 TaxID=2975984 RepID=UPI002E2C00A9|nr:hypothetical protein [Micromonospora sp. NBC_01699]
MDLAAGWRSGARDPFATTSRGLAFTAETCPDPGVERTFQTQVVDTYAEHRLAMFEALETTADPDQHGVIEGRAPKGAVLRIRKSFTMYTQPHLQSDGTTRPTPFDTTLTSDLKVSRSNGRFSWAVNPSYRPVPPYQTGGVQPNQTGFYREPWILTCERPDGTVLQRTPVNVNLGQRVTVDLKQCSRNFHRKSH